jgi:signal transduction histidine kinase
MSLEAYEAHGLEDHAEVLASTRSRYEAAERGPVTVDPKSRPAERINALGQMTTGVAHDLRNVLAVIGSGLRLAVDHAQDPDRLGACLEAAHDGVARGLTMVNRLLSFANCNETGAGRHDVNALLRDLEIFLGFAAGPGIKVSLLLTANGAECLVDPPQFNAAILNLVVNARDAMPCGGTIAVVTSDVLEQAPGGRGDLPMVRISVQDQGSGMSTHVASRVFEPFFTTKGEGGTGLGVPQVCAFTKMAGGHVRIDSVVGKGTVFDLFIPAIGRGARRSADPCQHPGPWTHEDGARGGRAMIGLAK